MRRAQLSLGPPSMLAATRMVRGSLALPFVAAAVAIYTSAALSWDGAALLFTLLDLQRISIPFARATVALFEYPTLLLSRYSSDVRALEVAYGLGYAVLPAACALASWQIVRRTHPRL